MFSRGVLAILAGGALAVGLSGCFGAPAVKTSTSAPAFASDKEAYAAAEKTYRAYVEATNALDYNVPTSLQPALDHPPGEANAADRKAFSNYQADGVRKHGVMRTVLLQPTSITSDRRQVHLAACIDVSGVELSYPDGRSAVDPDRVRVQRVAIELTSRDRPRNELLISSIRGRDTGPACE